MSDLAQLDKWLRKQCDALTLPMGWHIMAGRSLEDPQYRLQLGQHQAYMRVRSYLSGARKAARASMETTNER